MRALRSNGVTGGGLRTNKGVAAGALKVPGGLIHQQRTVLLSVGATACVGITSACHVTVLFVHTLFLITFGSF